MGLLMNIIGWAGTILVVCSMLMTSMKTLRTMNIIGSALSVAFCIYTGNIQMAVMNSCLIGINLYRLSHSGRRKK